MNGDGVLPKDSNMKDVSKGYDSTSNEDLDVIVPLRSPHVGCARCRRMFPCHVEFLNHLVGCSGIEKIRKLTAKQRRDQICAPAQRVEAGPSATPPRVLNLFNDPLKLRLAPPAGPPLELRLAPPAGPPPPLQPLNLDLTLATGLNKPEGSQQHPGKTNRDGPSDGNAGKNFRM